MTLWCLNSGMRKLFMGPYKVFQLCGHMIFVVTTQLCHCVRIAALENMWLCNRDSFVFQYNFIVDTEFYIMLMSWTYSYRLKKLFNVKTILNSWAIQNQVSGGIWLKPGLDKSNKEDGTVWVAEKRDYLIDSFIE